MYYIVIILYYFFTNCRIKMKISSKIVLISIYHKNFLQAFSKNSHHLAVLADLASAIGIRLSWEINLWTMVGKKVRFHAKTYKKSC